MIFISDKEKRMPKTLNETKKDNFYDKGFGSQVIKIKNIYASNYIATIFIK